MSKKRTQPVSAIEVLEAEPEPVQEASPEGLGSVNIDVPVQTIAPDAYCVRHVEVNRLTAGQAHALKRIVCACMADGCTHSGGKPVRGGGDVIRYILDQV